jgi:hypothetical protein
MNEFIRECGSFYKIVFLVPKKFCVMKGKPTGRLAHFFLCAIVGIYETKMGGNEIILLVRRSEAKTDPTSSNCASYKTIDPPLLPLQWRGYCSLFKKTTL